MSNSLIENGTSNTITVFVGTGIKTLYSGTSDNTVGITQPGTYTANDTFGNTWVINIPTGDNTKYVLVPTGGSASGYSLGGYSSVVGITPSISTYTYYLNNTVCTACPAGGCGANVVTYSDSACSNIVNGYACNNGNCTVVPGGQYTNFSTCKSNCQPPPTSYYLNGTVCTGCPTTGCGTTVATYSDSTCTQLINGYACSGGNCAVGPGGTYTTLASCQSNCSSSSVWFWVLIILGILVVVIVIGIVGFLIYEESKKKSAVTKLAASNKPVQPVQPVPTTGR